MPTYNADVTYVTKKGNLKHASFDVAAESIGKAHLTASETVLSNGQRQAVSVLDTRVTPESKLGFFARMFRRG
jgi:hypothetical protein